MRLRADLADETFERLYQAPKSSTHRRCAHPVMPAKAGIHDLPSLQQRKSWIPAFAGMTGWVSAESQSFGRLVLYEAPKRMTFRTGGDHRHHARSFRGGEVFGCARDGGQLAAIKQGKQSRKQVFFSLRNKGERSSARRTKNFGASRKNLIKLRAKRNHLPTLWTQSFSLVPL
jgi:hypothetical protein